MIIIIYKYWVIEFLMNIKQTSKKPAAHQVWLQFKLQSLANIAEW